MNRLTFIKNIIGLAGMAALPLEWVKQYDKYYLLQCFVKGFTYYEGPKLLDRMKEGDMLELKREPENEHDTNAIALHWNNRMVGYLPRKENKVLSKLLDIGVPELMAEITHLNPEAATWENVYIVVYVLKERRMEDYLLRPEHLTTLETPRYYSLKDNNHTVTRVWYDAPEQLDYYSFLVRHSANDSIYTMIHESLNGTKEYGVEDTVFVARKDSLAKLKDIAIRIDDTAAKLSRIFDEDKGYIVLKLKEAQKIIPRISKLAEVSDKMGNAFIELVV